MRKITLPFSIVLITCVVSIPLVAIGFTKIIGPNPEDRTCSDFDSWKEANSVYQNDKESYKHLDRDGDGKPCESLIRKSDHL